MSLAEMPTAELLRAWEEAVAEDDGDYLDAIANEIARREAKD